MDDVVDIRLGPGNLPAAEGDQLVTRVVVIDGHVVPHLAVFGPRESSPHGEAAFRISEDPVHHVDVVDGLFADLVT